MKTRLAILVRALAALGITALAPLSAMAVNWSYSSTFFFPTAGGNSYINESCPSSSNPILSAAPTYGPSVSFEQDIVIHSDGTFDVDTYLNGAHDGPTNHSASDAYASSFPGAGSYYCQIVINSGSVAFPLLDGNGDPYIELYDGSTGDGYQPNPWYNMDGSYSGTLDSSNDLTASMRGIIHFDGTPGWGGQVSWFVNLTAQ